LLFAVPGALLVWIDDRPGPAVQVLRYAFPAASAAALAAFLYLGRHRDRVPDYLHQLAGTFFNRDGFCFAFQPVVIDGVCYLNTYFQNQRDAPCVGRIAVRPSKGFFLTRAAIDTVGLSVACEPAAFGLARLAIPVPAKMQGTTQSFDVGASVEYPSGKGQRLRFRDGVLIRANTKFGDSTATVIALAGALTGHIVLSSPATVKMVLPSGVAERLDHSGAAQTSTLWRLGDPELQVAAAEPGDATDSR
jgi:hypothetical protein